MVPLTAAGSSCVVITAHMLRFYNEEKEYKKETGQERTRGGHELTLYEHEAMLGRGVPNRELSTTPIMITNRHRLLPELQEHVMTQAKRYRKKSARTYTSKAGIQTLGWHLINMKVDLIDDHMF